MRARSSTARYGPRRGNLPFRDFFEGGGSGLVLPTGAVFLAAGFHLARDPLFPAADDAGNIGPPFLFVAPVANRDGIRDADLSHGSLVPGLERDQPPFVQQSVWLALLCGIRILDGPSSLDNFVSGRRRSGSHHLVHAAQRGPAVPGPGVPAGDSLSRGIPPSVHCLRC